MKLRPAYRPFFAVRTRIALPHCGQSPNSPHFSRGGLVTGLGVTSRDIVPAAVAGVGKFGLPLEASGLRPNNLPYVHTNPQAARMNNRTPNPPEPLPRPPRREPPPPRPPPLPPPRAATRSLIKPRANSKSVRRESSFRSIVRYQADIG